MPEDRERTRGGRRGAVAAGRRHHDTAGVGVLASWRRRRSP